MAWKTSTEWPTNDSDRHSQTNRNDKEIHIVLKKGQFPVTEVTQFFIF